jgi:DNA-binding transcriptional ArsR family regulator
VRRWRPGASVQKIVDAVGTTQSHVSQLLATMRSKGILRTRRDANRVFYRVSDECTLDLVRLMREVFCGDPPQRRHDGAV